MSTLPGPIVDADHAQWRVSIGVMPPHDAQQSVFADGQHQSSREAGPRSAAQGKAQMMNNSIQPPGSSGGRPRDARPEPLGKDAPRTMAVLTAKPAHHEPYPDCPSMGGQIGKTSLVTAVDPMGLEPANWTGAARGGRTRHNGNLSRVDLDVLDQKAVRNQRFIGVGGVHSALPV